MVTLTVTLGAFLLVALGELLHARRLRRVATLAFGPSARPAQWATAAPWLRVLANTGLAWGLVTLMQVEPRVHAGEEILYGLSVYNSGPDTAPAVRARVTLPPGVELEVFDQAFCGFGDEE